MTYDKQTDARRLFERALELPAAVRDAFLADKCGADAELGQRVRAMLAALAGTPTPPAATAADPAQGAPAAVGEGPGSRIGPYKLLQQIGEGGFGAVFLAEQEQPVARRVALKVIKLGMDTRQVVARFEQERQALALMDHPHIARVLDAGVTASGRPYFVMDLVKGAPIVEYCDRHNLPIGERLELFTQVCSAVQHAHGKGIIHRDLKPSNVLVGVQDGRPQAKVIDFGIAKATSSKLTDKTLFTEHEQVIGTLQYMSPEQAEGSLDIDTRTDVYSLGVLLYELLTGTTPFDQRSIKQAVYLELRRMIREVEPPKPSTRLRDSQATLAQIAAHRRIEPRRLNGLIRGELDWIVMKALEKDRARRYETASGLAQDVLRHLAGEPVGAAPPGAGYRLRKFVVRHRGKVVALSAVAAALLLGLIGFAWQARIADGERHAAVLAREAEGLERQRAERQEQKANAINRFLLDMLGAADLRAAGREAKVAQALDRAADSVGAAFRDRPEVEAALRLILARTYLSLGMLDEAGPQVAAAVDGNRAVHGERSLEYARSIGTRGNYQGHRGEHPAAVASLQTAAALAVEVAGAEAQVTLGLQSDLANALVAAGQLDAGEALLRQTLKTQTRVFGRDNSDGQVLCNSLAVLLHQRAQLDEAEALYREALQIGRKVLGQDHPDTLTAAMNLGSMLHTRGKNDEAEPILVAAHRDILRVFGEAHPQAATACLVLANFYRHQGRFPEAVPLFEQCVACRVRAEGERSEAVATARSDLALAVQRLGDLPRAIALQQQAVDTFDAVLGAEAERSMRGRLVLANLQAASAPGSAEATFQDLLERCPRVLGDQDPLTIIVQNSYGVSLMGQDRYAEAEPFVRRALEVGRRAVGADHMDTLATHNNLVAVLRETGRLDEAATLGADLVERFTRTLGPRHPNTAHGMVTHGKTLLLQGRLDEARVLLTEAVAIQREVLGADNPAFCSAAGELGRVLVDLGDPAAAEPVLRQALGVSQTARGAGDRRTAALALELGRCLGVSGRFAEAEPMLREAEGTLARGAGGGAGARRATACLAEFYAAWHAAAPDPERLRQATEWQARAANAASPGK